MPADSWPRCCSAYNPKYVSLETSSPGAQTPKTPQASWGPFSPGSRSWDSRPSPRVVTTPRLPGLGVRPGVPTRVRCPWSAPVEQHGHAGAQQGTQQAQRRGDVADHAVLGELAGRRPAHREDQPDDGAENSSGHDETAVPRRPPDAAVAHAVRLARRLALLLRALPLRTLPLRTGLLRGHDSTLPAAPGAASSRRGS